MSDQFPTAHAVAPLTESELSLVEFYSNTGEAADDLARADAN